MPVEISEKLLKTVYNVLKPFADRGMVTLNFRYQLGDLMDEDEDDVLLEVEEKLINEGWVLQNQKNRLLTISEKLNNLIES